MKKITTIFVLAIFMLSIMPAALAEEGSDDVKDDELESEDSDVREKTRELRDKVDLSRDELKKLERLDRDKLRELKDLSEDKLKERLSDIRTKIVDKEDALRKRVLATNAVERAKENFLKARERFEAAKDKEDEIKDRFKAARDKVKACDETAEDCESLRTEEITAAKERLSNAANQAIEHLGKIKARIQENNDISEDEATAILQDLDNGIAKLEAAKELIAEATTKKEVKRAAKVIEKVWKNYEHRAAKHAARVIHSQVGEIITRSEHLEAKLDRVLAKLEANGVDTTTLDSKVEEFSTKISEAKALFEQSTEKFNQAKLSRTSDETDADKESAKALIREAKVLAKEAHQKLKEANRILVSIITEFRQAGADLESEDSETVEVVDEPEVEVEADEVDTTDGSIEEEVQEAETELEDEPEDEAEETEDSEDEAEDSEELEA